MHSEWTLDQELLEKTQSVRTAARVSLNDRKSVTHAGRRVTQSVTAVAQSYAMLGRLEEILPRLQAVIEAHLSHKHKE